MYEKPTIKIVNPDRLDDYIVIAKDKFDSKTDRLFQGGTPAPQVAAPQPEDHPVSDLVAGALDITVANLGPWLSKQADIDMLVHLMDLEPRPSAKALIHSRLNAIKKAQN